MSLYATRKSKNHALQTLSTSSKAWHDNDCSTALFEVVILGMWNVENESKSSLYRISISQKFKNITFVQPLGDWRIGLDHLFVSSWSEASINTFVRNFECIKEIDSHSLYNIVADDAEFRTGDPWVS